MIIEGYLQEYNNGFQSKKYEINIENQESLNFKSMVTDWNKYNRPQYSKIKIRLKELLNNLK